MKVKIIILKIFFPMIIQLESIILIKLNALKLFNILMEFNSLKILKALKLLALKKAIKE